MNVYMTVYVMANRCKDETQDFRAEGLGFRV